MNPASPRSCWDMHPGRPAVTDSVLRTVVGFGARVVCRDCGDCGDLHMADTGTIVPVDADSDFTLANLPYGIYSRRGDGRARPCTALGSFVVDLGELASAGCFPGPNMSGSDCFDQVDPPSMHAIVLRPS